MCIAVTGKLIAKDGTTGRVSVRGNVITTELGLVDAEIGDYVLVHAGCAIAKISQAENDELEALAWEMQHG